MSKHRVLRGGSYIHFTWGLRAADRYWVVPERRYRYIGFRLVVQRRKP